MSHPDVLIAGAGLAGLCCGIHLAERGIPVQILEASDAPGGRVRTDEYEGFRLDRGFQVLLTAYPEAQRMLDFNALRLGRFEAGAIVRFAGKFYEVRDPLRSPAAAARGLFSPIGSLADKLRVLRLRRRLARKTLDSIFAGHETTTLAALEQSGFSHAMIERFFRPFLGGIFLDSSLETSSRMFEFVFRMFTLGSAALPSGGMGAIVSQLVSRLPQGAVRVNARVESAGRGRVTLSSGEELRAKAVVIATEGPEAARLTGQVDRPAARSTTCVYFAAPEPPLAKPLLFLNANRQYAINNLCCVSEVAAGYAPPGEALISVSLIGALPQNDETLERMIRERLGHWFGRTVRSWRHLRTYRIPFALPSQPPGWLDPPERPVRLAAGLYVCGDHRDNASIQGAMVSGRRAAEAVAEDLSR